MTERAVPLDPTKHVTVSQVIVETDVNIVSISITTRKVFELKSNRFLMQKRDKVPATLHMRIQNIV